NPFKISKKSTLLISIIFSAIVSIDFNTSIYENIYLFLNLSIIFWGLIVLGISDYSSNKISNKIILMLISISLIFSAIDLQNNSFTLDNQSLLIHISGGILGFTVFLVVYLLPKQILGGGDVKLAGLIGIITGLPMVTIVLLLGLFSCVIIERIKNTSSSIPLGFYLVIITIIYLGIFNIFFQ
ncbi:MAG: hypothetical protein CL734_06440, partial [Chloroflexi bacterium]|nr:hypothetical protein [Chloroflexota bacterium]